LDHFRIFEHIDWRSVFDRYGNNSKYYEKLKQRATIAIREINYFFPGFFLKNPEKSENYL